MNTALLIFPHQLYQDSDGLNPPPHRVVLFEDPLFFGDPNYPARFHKQKLWLHRASMERYKDQISAIGLPVEIEPYRCSSTALLDLFSRLYVEGVRRIIAMDPVDMIASKRLSKSATEVGWSSIFVKARGS